MLAANGTRRPVDVLGRSDGRGLSITFQSRLISVDKAAQDNFCLEVRNFAVRLCTFEADGGLNSASKPRMDHLPG